jgi:hypothetical protein
MLRFRWAFLALASLIVAGCGGSTQLDQNSTCKQFMAAKPTVRSGVVSHLYSVTHDGAEAAPNVLTQTESVCRTKPGTNLINVPGLTFDAPSAPANVSSNQGQSSNQAASAPSPPSVEVNADGYSFRVSLVSITLSKNELPAPYLFAHVNLRITNTSDRNAEVSGISDKLTAAVRPSATKGCSTYGSPVPGWCPYDVVLNSTDNSVAVGKTVSKTMFIEGDSYLGPSATPSDIRIFVSHRELT